MTYPILAVLSVHVFRLYNLDSDSIGGLVNGRSIRQPILARVPCLGTGDEILGRFAGTIGWERGNQLAESPDVVDVRCTYSVYFHDYNVLLNIT